MHESHSPQSDEAASASPRSFGLLWAVVFAVVGLLPLWAGHPTRPWALALSGAMLCIALLVPVLLAAPTRAWMGLVNVLSKVTAPVALALVFFGLFSLYGPLLRLLGRDAMRRRSKPTDTTYWVERDPTERGSQHFNNQF